MRRTLPEAEVKIHLAILKLEEQHAEKIAKNEFQRYNRLREQKLKKEIKACEYMSAALTIVDSVDSEQERAKFFFETKDFEEMGEAKNQILEKVAGDPMIKKNLKQHIESRVSQCLFKYELKSELTEQQNLQRNLMVRDRIRAHQIKNLTLLEIQRNSLPKKNGLADMLRVHFKSQIDGQAPLMSASK